MDSLFDQLSERFQQLSERERSLLGVMGAVLGFVFVALVGYTSWTKVQTLQDDNDRRRAALDELVAEREAVLTANARAERVEQLLAGEPKRLSTYIEQCSGRAGVTRPREFRDREQPLDDGVLAQMTTASFPSMTLTQLNSLLDGIENDDETLVYTQQIAFEPPRGGASGLQVELTLMTFTREGSP